MTKREIKEKLSVWNREIGKLDKENEELRLLVDNICYNISGHAPCSTSSIMKIILDTEYEQVVITYLDRIRKNEGQREALFNLLKILGNFNEL